MKRLTIPLARIIVDPEQDTDLSSVSETKIQQLVRDCYSFLPKQTEISVENNAVVIVLQQDEALSGPAKKQYDRAVAAAEQGRYQKAIEQFEKVVEVAPSYTEARRNLAMAYLEAGQVEQAKRLLVETLRLDPYDTWAYVLLGNLYAKNEDNFERARHYYDQAYDLNPKDVYLITAYGALLANQEEYAQARSLFEKAIAINPSYPNSYGGLALTYLRENDPASALAALDDLFDRSSSNDIRNAPLYEEARQFYLEANRRISEASFDDLMEFVEDRRTALERRIGVSIRIEEDNTLDYVTGTTQMAWDYGRDYHLIKYRNRSTAITPAILAHELEHIALIHFAREVGRYRSFTTTAAIHEKAIRSIADYRYQLQRMGFAEDEITKVTDDMLTGLSNQLFNFPIDMIIEHRLYHQCPELRSSQFVSLQFLYYLETLPVLTDPEIKRLTPRQIHQANLVLNCTAALFVDHLYKGKTAYSSPYAASSIYSRAQRLFGLWQETIKGFEPGDEYDLVDQFAEAMNLRDWYEWRLDRIETPQPEGVTNPELLEAKESASTMYCLDALERFEGMSRDEVLRIAGEIALLGRDGIDYASADKVYTLNSIAGKKFSGLHLLCLMYVGFQQVDPSIDIGVDLSESYQLALRLHRGQE